MTTAVSTRGFEASWKEDLATGGSEYVGAVMDVTAVKAPREALEKAHAEIQELKDQFHRENIVLREEIDRTSMFEEIVGSSPPLRAVLSQLSRVAPTACTVLITGETGTGKELIARAIHKRSPRSSRAFVGVNCAAIPSSLIVRSGETGGRNTNYGSVQLLYAW